MAQAGGVQGVQGVQGKVLPAHEHGDQVTFSRGCCSEPSEA